MNEDAIHAESIGYRARMLSTRSSKGDQRVPAHIVASGHRNLLNGIGHVFDSDSQKAAGQTFRSKIADLQDKFCKPFPDKFYIDREIAIRTEDFRKQIGRQTPEHDIAIGYRERTVAAVTNGPRVGACAIWANPQTGSIKPADGTTAGSDGMDIQHRSA